MIEVDQRPHHFNLLSLSFAVSSSKDNFVKWWDLDTQHCFNTMVGHRSEVRDCCTILTMWPDHIVRNVVFTQCGKNHQGNTLYVCYSFLPPKLCARSWGELPKASVWPSADCMCENKIIKGPEKVICFKLQNLSPTLVLFLSPIGSVLHIRNSWIYLTTLLSVLNTWSHTQVSLPYLLIYVTFFTSSEAENVVPADWHFSMLVICASVTYLSNANRIYKLH